MALLSFPLREERSKAGSDCQEPFDPQDRPGGKGWPAVSPHGHQGQAIGNRAG